ncbi:hypothetical protein MHYP_G00103210 [Metynnis hypsauchen]
MKLLQLFIWVILLAMRHETSGLEIRGYERGSVSVTCSHSWAGSNTKYFCKNPCKTNEDILIDSTKKSSGRYQMTDSWTGVFTVEITRLNKEDAGKYWCGVDRVFGDTYTEVILTVLDAPQTSPPPSSSTHLPTTATSLGNILTSNATFAAVSVSAPAASDQPNDAKIPAWQIYLIISVCVLLLTSAIWIQVILALYHKVRGHPTLASFQCCSRRTQFDVSEYDGNSFGKQSSVSQSRPPAAEDTEPDYENICAATKFPAEEHIYSNQ